MRESKESPRLKAFCRVAPSVLFNDRAIFPAGVLFRASAVNVRTCSDVHARRFSFRLAIISPSGTKRSLVAARNTKEKINFWIVWNVAACSATLIMNIKIAVEGVFCSLQLLLRCRKSLLRKIGQRIRGAAVSDAGSHLTTTARRSATAWQGWVRRNLLLPSGRGASVL